MVGMSYQQTQDDLERLLHEQVRFLRRSADAYDQGDEGEAKRLATHIRLLVHDTGRSHSLLGLLAVKDQLRYEDTTLRHIELPAGSTVIHSGIVITEMAFGPRSGVRFAAPLGDLPPERIGPPVPFQDWWEPAVLTDSRGNSFSRKSYILSLANQDGGAHVDPELQKAYAALSKDNSLGRWGSDDEGVERPLDNIVLASVRQIAYELDISLSKQLRELVPQ